MSRGVIRVAEFHKDPIILLQEKNTLFHRVKSSGYFSGVELEELLVYF